MVHVHSEKAREARKGVLEFLLINHPLDCPICDQSGECELQDYTFMEGRKESRLRDPKRFNPAEDFGGDVLYVTNRCILCTRCVRFMDTRAQDAVLNVSDRGDRATIGKFEGKDLTHPWAGNVIDLCPVGALLSKDSLNKARAWELDRTASVCPNCSQGCNMIIETREQQVVRLRPRSNEAVTGGQPVRSAVPPGETRAARSAARWRATRARPASAVIATRSRPEPRLARLRRLDFQRPRTSVSPSTRVCTGAAGRSRM